MAADFAALGLAAGLAVLGSCWLWGYARDRLAVRRRLAEIERQR